MWVIEYYFIPIEIDIVAGIVIGASRKGMNRYILTS